MRLRKPVTLGVLLSIFAIAAYLAINQGRPSISLDPTNPCERAKKVLEEGTISILKDADKVEVFRIDGRSDGERTNEPGNRIHGYLVKHKGKDQGREFAQDLAGILFHERTYSNGYAACFFPGIVFRPWAGEKSVTVVLCLECDQLLVNFSRTISFYNSPLRANLVRLAKQAFPEDPEIQELRGP